MTIDEELLKAARTAQARVVDADRSADIARADFRHAVRRLHLAGGSLREIAEALGLSHQRVHQVVEEAGGARPWRVVIRRGRAKRGDLRECSFCGKNQAQVKKLIAGPSVYICDWCIGRADQVIATGEVATTALSAITAIDADVTTVTCSFCGKNRQQASGLAAAAKAAICAECLLLCHEIVSAERV